MVIDLIDHLGMNEWIKQQKYGKQIFSSLFQYNQIRLIIAIPRIRSKVKKTKQKDQIKLP